MGFTKFQDNIYIYETDGTLFWIERKKRKDRRAMIIFLNWWCGGKRNVCHWQCHRWLSICCFGIKKGPSHQLLVGRNETLFLSFFLSVSLAKNQLSYYQIHLPFCRYKSFIRHWNETFFYLFQLWTDPIQTSGVPYVFDLFGECCYSVQRWAILIILRFTFFYAFNLFEFLYNEINLWPWRHFQKLSFIYIFKIK